jgi:tetratricopeptide (TPR) repeat protein
VGDVIAGLRAIQLAGQNKDVALTKPTVAYLLGALNATASDEDTADLLQLLALEYRKFGIHDKELQAIEEAIRLRPDDPMPHIAWSSSCLHRDLYKDAREAAQKAVSKSEASGRFRRHSLQTLARTLTALREFNDLEMVIEKLIQLGDVKPDWPIETDFLVGLPADSVREELKQRFLSLKGAKLRS